MAVAATTASAHAALLTAHAPSHLPLRTPTRPTPSEARIYIRCRLLRPRSAISSQRAGHSPAGPRTTAAVDHNSRLSCVAAIAAAGPSPRALQPCWAAECTARADAVRLTRRCGRGAVRNGSEGPRAIPRVTVVSHALNCAPSLLSLNAADVYMRTSLT